MSSLDFLSLRLTGRIDERERVASTSVYHPRRLELQLRWSEYTKSRSEDAIFVLIQDLTEFQGGEVIFCG